MKGFFLNFKELLFNCSENLEKMNFDSLAYFSAFTWQKKKKKKVHYSTMKPLNPISFSFKRLWSISIEQLRI